MNRFLIIFLTVSSALLTQANPYCPKSVPRDVCEFESFVYSQVDFKNTEEVRNLMIQFKKLILAHTQDSSLIQERILDVGNQIIEEAYEKRAPKNILALADQKSNLMKMLPRLKEWEEKNGQILPLDWKLPKGFLIAIASIERSYQVTQDRTRYGFSLFIPTEHFFEVEELQVTDQFGTAIIDKATKLGEFNQDKFHDTDFTYISANSSGFQTPLKDGLYSLKIKVKGQNLVNGWFILRGSNSPNPLILNPQVNERYSTKNPSFFVQDFKSNSLLTSDHRKRSLYVFKEGDDKNLWKESIINPKDDGHVKLQKSSNQSGAEELSAGSYRFKAVFEERSFFGDITIGRSLSTSVPFKVSQ